MASRHPWQARLSLGEGGAAPHAIGGPCVGSHRPSGRPLRTPPGQRPSVSSAATPAASSPSTNAAPIFQGLQGRSPCTSPVQALMATR